jgi:hypothetical protein
MTKERVVVCQRFTGRMDNTGRMELKVPSEGIERLFP